MILRYKVVGSNCKGIYSYDYHRVVPKWVIREFITFSAAITEGLWSVLWDSVLALGKLKHSFPHTLQHHRFPCANSLLENTGRQRGSLLGPSQNSMVLSVSSEVRWASRSYPRLFFVHKSLLPANGFHNSCLFWTKIKLQSMPSVNMTFLGNLRWSFSIESNLLTQRNSQSGAYFVHEGKKNDPFVSAWRWSQIRTETSYVFAQTEATNRGSSGPTQPGSGPPRFWEAGAMWAQRDWTIRHYMDRCNLCREKRSAETTVRMSAGVISGQCVLPQMLLFSFMFIVILLLLFENNPISWVSFEPF